MVKITDLPIGSTVDGSELVPVVQDDAMRRVTIGALLEKMTTLLPNWYKGDKGDPSGPLGLNSVTADTINGEDAAAIADKLGVLRSGETFTTAVGADNSDAYVLNINSTAVDHQVDGILVSHALSDPAAIGYAFHGITFSADGVPNGVGGGMGGAIGGPGAGSGVVGNRREDGFGYGGIFTRAETGDGGGVLGTFQSTGNGAGVIALKQNSNGAPGGPHGTGPALRATNSSEEGEAINSLTTGNNASAVSNVMERQNSASGIVERVMILQGGARTGSLTGTEVLIQPGIPSPGASGVAGQSISITENVIGSASAVGSSVSNSATGGAGAYGYVGNVFGANDSNYGGYFRASGGTNNFAIYCADGDAFFAGIVKAPNLPVFANNDAASATLHQGDLYRTPAGQVMVVF